MRGVLDRFRPASVEEAARRSFGLWALVALVFLLPLWWVWGADLMATILRPFAGVVMRLFGLTGEIRIVDGGDWSVGTYLTAAGQPVVFTVPEEVLRRLLLGGPLVAAFLIAPPRAPRPLRAFLICTVVLAVTFTLALSGYIWGQLAPQLNPDLAGIGMETGLRLDQPALHPFLAQVAIVTRYVGLSVAPLVTAVILWAALNPEGYKTLVAEPGPEGRH